MTGEQQPEQPLLDVVRGAPTEEELAALIAVVTDAYAREAAGAVVREERVSAWTRTQRPLRAPLRRDIPWGRFSG
ncbi:acyl-CoA carboxylase subunit epsilon [Microbacterium sp.]|uniref:acyl-CoA carboxylase subunit epsilon n=1 Tax=Microbacterium sp. TaxID=51671 RepID=UPI003341180C